MTPELVKRTHQSWDTEDLAWLFIEEEVGRHDWRNNWPKRKESGKAREQIQSWLEAMKIEHDPDEIISYLDQSVKERAGKYS